MNEQGMFDLTGWVPIDCATSDAVREAHSVKPGSSLTDPEGNYSSGVIFTEWWSKADDVPILRDYRYSDERPCAHYVTVHREANQ